MGTLLKCNIDIETDRKKQKDRKIIRQKMMNRTQKTSRQPPMTFYMFTVTSTTIYT